MLVRLLPLLGAVVGRGCYKPLPFIGPNQTTAPSHSHISVSSLPSNFDWRNVNGINYCSRVMTQQMPAVCGSCWAEAAMGAFSDRFAIATNNSLKIQLAVQVLLNFNGELTGGGCLGGDSGRAYKFAHNYGVTDDTCAPFLGVNYGWGFEHAEGLSRDDVLTHLCQACGWDGGCNWMKQGEFDYYSAQDYGEVLGPEQMMAEIYARGPIACSVNSSPDSFDLYKGGVIDDPTKFNDTDHVVAITGWGVDPQTQQPYWVGRNSYGTRWGEGAGGGWFRLLRGKNTLAMEAHNCHWAVPSQDHVARALKQARDSQ